MTELEAEFDAQISRVKQPAGARLTHIDSQSNQHLAYFDLFFETGAQMEHPADAEQGIVDLHGGDPSGMVANQDLRAPAPYLARPPLSAPPDAQSADGRHAYGGQTDHDHSRLRRFGQ